MVAAFRTLIDFKITGSYFLEVNKSIYLIVPDGPFSGSKSPAPITWLDEVQSEIIRFFQFFNAQRSSVLAKIKGNRKIDVRFRSGIVKADFGFGINGSSGLCCEPGFIFSIRHKCSFRIFAFEKLYFCNTAVDRSIQGNCCSKIQGSAAATVARLSIVCIAVD